MRNHPLVEKAYKFAEISLAGKKRYSGELFTDHVLKVATTLEQYKVIDPITLTVAILHHTLSDSAATMQDIEKEFGSEIAAMLSTLEKLRVLKITESKREDFAENLRKMFLALASDLRIVLIKLADILDNLKTLQYLPVSKQVEVARETIEIFAPMAERLGIGEMKGEMQDLAFPYLYPDDYQKTIKLLKTSSEELNETLLKIKEQLKLALSKEGLNYCLESRTKHLYSLYTKLSRPEINFDISKVYDLIAFRVIVSTTEECYKALGIIHNLWRPLPNYVRDYIATPRPNGYQSIHTTVFGPEEQLFEIQIRTEKMHEEAEYGVAAHWNYAEVKSKGTSDVVLTKGVVAASSRLQWVKQLSKWQEETEDNEEFLKSVKTDFFGKRIFVFTPKGDVKDLPAKATPVDFAYNVHTGLGDKTLAAKVNGKVTSLGTQLKNGDVVEIIVSKQDKKPSRDWLKFVVTAQAKRKIKRAYFN